MKTDSNATPNQMISILDHLHFECPTREQKNALSHMADFVSPESKDDFFILCGAAGTGKSSITSAVVSYLNSKEITYQIAAPTGRAARIIGRKTQSVNNTIHSMIYKVNSDPQTGVVKFTLKPNNATEFTLYIVDEASMISTVTNNSELTLFKSENSLFSDLIRFVKAGNPQNKIIFLGDRNQLPPINENDSMALIPKYLEEMYSLKGSIQFLTVVKRQEDGSNIMQNAVNTRVAIESGKQNAAISAYKFNSIFTAAKHYVKDYRTNAPEFCISINPFHKGNQLFNRVVRENLYGNRVRTIEVGDWMLITQKWCRNGLELFNGDHVIVEAFDPNVIENVAGLFFSPIRLKAKNLAGVEVMIDDYVLIDSIQHPNGSLPIEQEKMLRGERYRKNPVYRNSGFMSDDKYVGAIRLTYGYSITCHKAQGGEWSKVYMSTFHIPSLKYQYTAITRAVDQLVIY